MTHSRLRSTPAGRIAGGGGHPTRSRFGLGRRLSVLGLGTVVVAAAGLAACQPSEPSITRTGSSALVVADDGTVSYSLRCTASAACTGKTRLNVAGKVGTLYDVSIPAGQVKVVTATLTPAQVAATPVEATVKGEIRLEEKAPAALSARGIVVSVRRPTPPVTETPTSKAYRERNWTPTAIDTCSAELHRRYSVIGPDGKLYPSWHPPTVTDPGTGQACTFGHEHGDDPAGSDIYTWVTDFLGADPEASRGIPFGYVSEALDTYASDTGAVTRHEDNVGHKVIVANNVRLVTESPRGYLRDRAGEPITCDVLMKVHQGSHSSDALINNAHELLYASRCTDGTEIISSTMTRFGNPNEFHRSCAEATKITTAGSNLPAGDGGDRLIPDRFCVDRDVLVPEGRSSSIWSLYEVWRSVNDLRRADGSSLASFDPWFGIRNPARAHAGGVNSTSFDLVDVPGQVDEADGGIVRGYPFDEVLAHEHATGTNLAKVDPASPFDGAQRDYYLQANRVTNAGGPTTWWTDPYGGGGVAEARPGYLRQYLSATDNSSWPTLERRSANLEKDYGHHNGVHAPN